MIEYKLSADSTQLETKERDIDLNFASSLQKRCWRWKSIRISCPPSDEVVFLAAIQKRRRPVLSPHFMMKFGWHKRLEGKAVPIEIGNGFPLYFQVSFQNAEGKYKRGNLPKKTNWKCFSDRILKESPAPRLK